MFFESERLVERNILFTMVEKMWSTKQKSHMKIYNALVLFTN